jgi:hypothetical protein
VIFASEIPLTELEIFVSGGCLIYEAFEEFEAQ